MNFKFSLRKTYSKVSAHKTVNDWIDYQEKNSLS